MFHSPFNQFILYRQEVTSVPITTAYNDLRSTTIASTLVDSLDNIELIQIPSALAESDTLNNSLFSLEECNNENMQSVDMESLPIAVESENIPVDDQINCDTEYPDGLGMANYQVQLMDQYNVTDQVEFSDEQIHSNESQHNLSIDDIYGVDDGTTKSNDVVLSYLCHEAMLFEDLPLEVMESLDNSMSNKDFQVQTEDDACTDYEKMCRSLNSTQLESYFNWLDSVIETTNLVLDFNNDGYPEPLIFSVPHVRKHVNHSKCS